MFVLYPFAPVQDIPNYFRSNASTFVSCLLHRPDAGRFIRLPRACFEIPAVWLSLVVPSNILSRIQYFGQYIAEGGLLVRVDLGNWPSELKNDSHNCFIL